MKITMSRAVLAESNNVGYAVHGLGLTPFVETILVRVGEAVVEEI